MSVFLETHLEQIGYQVVHAITGRIRVRISWLETDPEATNQLQRRVESMSFVSSVRINPLAQSIVIAYKPNVISIEEAQERFIEAIQQVKPTPPAPPPPSATPATPPPSETQSVSADPPASEGVNDVIETPVNTARSSPSDQPQESKNSFVSAEIPSPWDEPQESKNSGMTEISDDSAKDKSADSEVSKPAATRRQKTTKKTTERRSSGKNRK